MNRSLQRGPEPGRAIFLPFDGFVILLLQPAFTIGPIGGHNHAIRWIFPKAEYLHVQPYLSKAAPLS